MVMFEQKKMRGVALSMNQASFLSMENECGRCIAFGPQAVIKLVIDLFES